MAGGTLGNADEVIAATQGVVSKLEEIDKRNISFALTVAGQNSHNIQASIGDHIVVLQGIGLSTEKHIAAGKAAEEAVAILDKANELAKEAIGLVIQARDSLRTIPGLLTNGSQGYLLNERPTDAYDAKPRHLRSIKSDPINKKEDDA
jgi:hypothetical protein